MHFPYQIPNSTLVRAANKQINDIPAVSFEQVWHARVPRSFPSPSRIKKKLKGRAAWEQQEEQFFRAFVKYWKVRLKWYVPTIHEVM